MKSIKIKPVLSDVFDIHGKNIKLGDKVKFLHFYKSSYSSEDTFGTEPQVSFTVYEEYFEDAIGEVVYELGAFCFKYLYGESEGQTIAIRDIIKNSPNEVVEHYMCGYGDEISFEDEVFWGVDFEDRLPNGDEKEWTSVEHQKYWETIRTHLETKFKEFEIVG